MYSWFTKVSKMNCYGQVRRGEYYDSISIMLIARQVAAMPGIADSAVVMATPGNRSVLEASGIFLPEFSNTTDTDLLVAVKVSDNRSRTEIIAAIDEIFRSARKTSSAGEFHPRSLEAGLQALPDANCVMISVAGRYAAGVAMDALRHDRHVFLFSDNVGVEQELELKQYASSKGLFVMGPDCGTSIINGVPMAFANVVDRGPIGIVAASGTGLQEVTTLISNAGSGVSQAIGTGGRDVKKAIGGIMFLQGLRALAEDPATSVILLVSKPPDPEVLAKIVAAASAIPKPVIGLFLGAAPSLVAESAILSASTLEEAAAMAVACAQGRKPEVSGKLFAARDAAIRSAAGGIASKLLPGQCWLRGLFSGGTFCDEAQLLARDLLKPLWSNTPVARVSKLASAWKSEGHTIVDLGDDEFTVGTPHPMIDYTTRCKRLIAEAEDTSTAVILLDIVLGYGSTMNPLGDILPAINQINTLRKGLLPIVCSVTGTRGDPQGREAVVAGLAGAGVIVKESNAAASLLAIHIAAAKEGRS
jgi:FdrA protein